MAVVFAANVLLEPLIVKPVKGVLPPTMPFNVTVPVPAEVTKLDAPLIVLPKVMALFVVDNVEPVLNVTAPE